MSVSKGKWGPIEDAWDIVLWADHRAAKEAAEINATGSSVLKYVGETMSLEMCVVRCGADCLADFSCFAGNCLRFYGSRSTCRLSYSRKCLRRILKATEGPVRQTMHVF